MACTRFTSPSVKRTVCVTLAIVMLLMNCATSHVVEKKSTNRQCLRLGDGCNGIPRCCGHTQCFWQDGWSLIEDGVCVECVTEGNYCQSQDNCCDYLQCDKNSRFSYEGTCEQPRRAGEACFKDSQCNHHCEIGTFQLTGMCRDY